MISPPHASHVQQNNVIGTLGLLWVMHEVCPNTSLIKLGTMGEYGAPISGRPIFEGTFPDDAQLHWDNREWSLGGEMTSRDPVSFYHVSKVQDTYNIFGACKYWGLRSYDVMQGVIYGIETEEMEKNDRLRTRFDVDEIFGTAINRFVGQAVIDMPLTLYGKGQQIRGFIHINDAMDCMVRLISTPPASGEYEVVNQLSGLHNLSDLAETVAKIGNEKFELNVKIQRMKNPRKELEEHPYEVVSKNLPNKLGFKPKISIEKGVQKMFGTLMRTECRQNLAKCRKKMIPFTQWDSKHRQAQNIETYQPGVKKNTSKYKPKLDK